MSRSMHAFVALLTLSFALGTARIASADGAGATASKPVDLENTRCPVKGIPVAPGVTQTVDGMVVHFCCMKCAATYAADPARYQAALRADPEVARRMAMAHPGGAAAGDSEPVAPPPADKGLAFHDAMRRLWEDHVTWTRLYVVSAVAGLPDADATLQRLLRNQDDIGNGIKPFYGDEAGAKLTALLREHITIAGELVGAAAAGDHAKADAASRRWTANADEIAAFLAKANPTSWPLDAGRAMMHEHLALTTAEAQARIAKDWNADVAAYEKVHDQALKMADMLSDGIRRQFPQKFQ